MGSRVKRWRPSPAFVLSVIALFFELSGIGYAVATIGTGDIKNGAVTKKKLHKKSVTNKAIRNKAINGAKVKDGSLTGNDIDESTLGTVPNADHANSADTATNADHATNADTATNADHANSADTATNADHATSADTATSAANADNLDGQDSSAFLSSSSRGVAVVGAVVSTTGVLNGYFNRSGGTPTVTHTGGTGKYTISFPGVSINTNFQIVQASLYGTAGEIAVNSVSGNVIIQTYNSAGSSADRAFTLVVFPASLVG